MSFPIKMQSRIWCVSLIYRHIILDEPIERIDRALTSVDELREFFNDQIIFEYNKGDIDYFIKIYGTIAIQLSDIMSYFDEIIDDDRTLSHLLKSTMICALAEMIYMDISPELLVIEYTKLMNNYGDHESNKILTQLKDIQISPDQEINADQSRDN